MQCPLLKENNYKGCFRSGNIHFYNLKLDIFETGDQSGLNHIILKNRGISIL
jgi:hypothetical protein